MAEIYYRIETVCEVLELSRAQVRRYEQVGLLVSVDDGERRTAGRRYSEEDVRRLRRLRRMQRDLGLNLAGLEVAMHLLEQIEALRRRLGEGGS